METAMTYLCTDYSGSKRTIDLSPEINEQDLLTVLCWHYEEAARFVLDWAYIDIDEAAQYMSTFLVHLFNNVSIYSPNMPSKHPENPGLQSPGGSFCSVAFQSFCELLHENIELVRLIRELPPYATVEKKMDILGQRETNWIYLTRGYSWEASPSFKNPNPIPRKIQESFQRRLKEFFERQAAEAKREEEERIREKEQKTKERYRKAAHKQIKIKKKSAQKKAFRDHFITLSVDSQLRMLVSFRQACVK